MNAFRVFFCFALMLGLAACASDDKEAKKPKPICPQVVIVRDLENIQDYGAEKPDPSQLVSQAMMKNVDGDCAYEKDDRVNGVDINFDLTMAAMRGPRLGGNHINLPFFVAVADPDHNILQKEPMTVDFHLSSDQKAVERTESLHVFIPLPKDKWPTGPNYQVLIGFQLTEEQIKAVREKEESQNKAPSN